MFIIFLCSKILEHLNPDYYSNYLFKQQLYWQKFSRLQQNSQINELKIFINDQFYRHLQIQLLCLLNIILINFLMIKILNLTSKRTFHFFNHRYSFSSTSDPYYILGVQKRTDFKEIKKSFYKLANEYHPDKNDSADAKKKFLLVKQAFEQIKIERGLMKPQNFVDVVQPDSVRANADQFTHDEQQGYKSTRDYRIFRQKAGMDAKYSQFNSSFQTIHDINDIKIKVEQGEMKDASQRFKLSSMKAKIVSRSESSLTVVVIGMVGIFFILTFINVAYMGSMKNIEEGKIIKASEEGKQQKVQNQKERNEKSKIQRQKKIKHQELMNIITQTIQKDNKEKSSSKKSAINQRLAWTKLVNNQKQDFITSNQRVI